MAKDKPNYTMFKWSKPDLPEIYDFMNKERIENGRTMQGQMEVAFKKYMELKRQEKLF